MPTKPRPVASDVRICRRIYLPVIREIALMLRRVLLGAHSSIYIVNGSARAKFVCMWMCVCVCVCSCGTSRNNKSDVKEKSRCGRDKTPQTPSVSIYWWYNNGILCWMQFHLCKVTLDYIENQISTKIDVDIIYQREIDSRLSNPVIYSKRNRFECALYMHQWDWVDNYPEPYRITPDSE